MNELTYESRVVLALFGLANPGRLNPTWGDIVRFDRELRRVYEATLEQVLRQFGVPFNVANKSLILLYQPNMRGSTPTLRIKNFCMFFQSTVEILSIPVATLPEARRKASPARRAARRNAARA